MLDMILRSLAGSAYQSWRLLVELAGLSLIFARNVLWALRKGPPHLVELSLFLAVRALEHGKHWWRFVRENVRGQWAADYVYTPLPDSKTFRLLSIEPGGWTSPLECSLREASLDDGVEFTATSYTWERDSSWTQRVGVGLSCVGYVVAYLLMGLPVAALLGSRAGDLVTLPAETAMSISTRIVSLVFGDHRHVISCNGKRMAVRANLYDFLLQLRQSGNRGAKYWIDAICVNQNNVLERNHHVLLMTTIYRRAEQVFAWLGTCPSLLDSPKTMGRVHLDFELSHVTNSEIQTLSDFLRIPLRACARIHILSRGYFSRTWIIQEVLLPTRVSFLVGRYQLSPEDMADVVRMTDTSLAATALGFTVSSLELVGNLLKGREEYRAKGTWTLSEYLAAVLGHRTSDPRDLVYAGLGLISSSGGDSTVARADVTIHSATPSAEYRQESLLYSPDYAAEQLDVYLSCAYDLLVNEGLYALSFACSGPTALTASQQPIPSWLPHLHLDGALPPLRIDLGDTFFAGGNTKAVVALMPEHRLHLDSGADRVDVLERVFRITGKGMMEVLGCLPDKYAITGEPKLAALARTLITDGADGRRIAPTSYTKDFINLLFKISTPAENLLLEQYDADMASKAVMRKGPLQDIMTAKLNTSREGIRLKRRWLQDVITKSEQAAHIDRTSLFPDEQIGTHHAATQDARSFDDDRRESQLLAYVRSEEAKNTPGGRCKGFLETLSGVSSSAYERAFEKRRKNRSFFVTKKGYIGLGSSELRKGDVVMVLSGAYVPFAMRPTSPTARGEVVSYRLRGEVYVHGIMDGERLSSPEWDPKPIVIE